MKITVWLDQNYVRRDAVCLELGHKRNKNTSSSTHTHVCLDQLVRAGLRLPNRKDGVVRSAVVIHADLTIKTIRRLPHHGNGD